MGLPFFLVPGFLFHNNHNFMALWVMSYTYVLCSPKKSPCSWPDQHLAILKTGGSGRNRRSNWQVTKRNKKHSDVLLGRFYLGKIPNLTNVFQRGLKPPTRLINIYPYIFLVIKFLMSTRTIACRTGFSIAWTFFTNFNHSHWWNEFLAENPTRSATVEIQREGFGHVCRSLHGAAGSQNDMTYWWWWFGIYLPILHQSLFCCSLQFLQSWIS